MILPLKPLRFAIRNLLYLDYCVDMITTMDLSTKFPQESSVSQPEINTLVFFDTESTGLPSMQSPKTVQITELTMVAVHRKHFDDPAFNFRVLNKLSLCIQPRSFVSPGASNITGLDNVNLETQRNFSSSTAKLLNNFLCELEPPICLLAHNGKTFDFPLLKAEMTKTMECFSNNIFFLDTYRILREIIPPPGYTCNNNSPHISTSETSHLSLEEIINNGRILQESLLKTPPKVRTKFPRYSPPASQSDGNSTCSTSISREDLSFSQELPIDSSNKESGSSPESSQRYPVYSPIFKTPTSCTPKDTFTPVKTPFRKVLFSSNENNNYLPSENVADSNRIAIRTTSDRCVETVNIASDFKTDSGPAKKVLIGGTWKKNVKGYKLFELYERVVGEPFTDAHEAEADTIALMKLCFHVKDFSLWMDAKAELFTDVKSMW